MELVDVVGVAAAQVGVGQRRYGRIVGAGHRTGRLDVAHVRRIVVADGAASAAASVAQRRSVRRPIVALARPQHHVLIGRICAKQEKLNQQQTQHQSPPAHSNPIPPLHPPPAWWERFLDLLHRRLSVRLNDSFTLRFKPGWIW